MPSQINPDTIDPTFPVPGVNQPSQGFRSNFSAIQNNFKQTEDEMNDLFSKVIVSAPLDYGTNSNINDFGGMQNANLSLYDHGLKVWNNGTAGSVLNANFANGAYHTYTVGANCSVNISNFPNLGYSELILDISTSASPVTINFSNVSPSSVTIDAGLVQNFNRSTQIYTISAASSNNIIHIGSTDGTNWKISVPNQSPFRSYRPSSTIGSPGDRAGMQCIVAEQNKTAICIKDYDGSSNIWFISSSGYVTWP